jgi:succinate-acetate transporter protein
MTHAHNNNKTHSDADTDVERGDNTPKTMHMYPPFGGELRVAPYTPSLRKFANPGPLGLSAFALTTFVLSLINFQTRDVTTANVVVGMAFGYGGLVQLLAGMWEMASGNTFAATALSSYGGFWLSWAMIYTPGFGIASAYAADKSEYQDALGFYLMGWFIFTFLLLLCTMKSTVAFFTLFLTLDIAFLCLGLSHLFHSEGVKATAHVGLQKAGGMFGLIAAFLAWYNAYAGMADRSNSFIQVHVVHFPWSDTAKLRKQPSHVD